MSEKELVKLSVKVTPEFNTMIEKLARDLTQNNKSELFRKAITLMNIYDREHKKDEGIDLALVKDGKIEARLII